eukprot:306235-Rhodomonas_salina.1
MNESTASGAAHSAKRPGPLSWHEALRLLADLHRHAQGDSPHWDTRVRIRTGLDPQKTPGILHICVYGTLLLRLFALAS